MTPNIIRLSDIKKKYRKSSEQKNRKLTASDFFFVNQCSANNCQKNYSDIESREEQGAWEESCQGSVQKIAASERKTDTDCGKG